MCVNTCREGAIALYDGKARLIRDDYCDGLGSCLPVCPKGAIEIEEREADTYDKAVRRSSELRQWPVQIKLVPVNAPYFNGANLLIAADCAAYACGTFHQQYMKGKISIIGCPKLDNVDYTEKLAEIIARNEINSVTVARMEVPCCAGMEYVTQSAVRYSGKPITLRVYSLPIN